MKSRNILYILSKKINYEALIKQMKIKVVINVPASAIKGIYHNGKIEPLEQIPYKEDKDVVILFLDNKEKEDKLWDESVAKDFLSGYSVKDIAYDKI